jgi:hypothetical protein
MFEVTNVCAPCSHKSFAEAFDGRELSLDPLPRRQFLQAIELIGCCLTVL